MQTGLTKPMKRIEIVVPSMELKKVLNCLDNINISGYSVIRNVIGKGDRGNVGEEEELDVLGNDYILAICEATQEEPLMLSIRPVLKRYGGICISSDANWLVHERNLW